MQLDGLYFGAITGTITVNMLASIDSWSPTQVFFRIGPTTPVGNPGVTQLTTSDGRHASSSLFGVTPRQRPYVFSYTPAQVTQGDTTTAVTMAGAQFGATTGTLVLGGIYTATIQSWTDTTIVFHIAADTPAFNPIYVNITSPDNGFYKEFGGFGVVPGAIAHPDDRPVRLCAARSRSPRGAQQKRRPGLLGRRFAWSGVRSAGGGSDLPGDAVHVEIDALAEDLAVAEGEVDHEVELDVASTGRECRRAARYACRAHATLDHVALVGHPRAQVQLHVGQRRPQAGGRTGGSRPCPARTSSAARSRRPRRRPAVAISRSRSRRLKHPCRGRAPRAAAAASARARPARSAAAAGAVTRTPQPRTRRGRQRPGATAAGAAGCGRSGPTLAPVEPASPPGDRQTPDERIERLFEMTSDLLATISLDGRFTLLNPAWEAVLGWTREELAGEPGPGASSTPTTSSRRSR